MALFNFTIHLPELERRLERIESHLHFIIKQQIQMANEINAFIDRMETAMANIRQDITDIKDGLPDTGGLSAEETAAIKARLQTLVTNAEALDAENERPEIPPTEEA